MMSDLPALDRKPLNLWLVLALALIVFSTWHALNRGVWDPISVYASLRLRPDAVAEFKSYDPNIFSFEPYDSTYLYTQTYDPLASRRNHLNLFDAPTYRYQRMLYPFLANALALGKPTLFPYTLFLINVVSFIVGGMLVWKLSAMHKWNAWLVLTAYGFNTGLLYSVFRDLVEPLALALALAGILYALVGAKKRSLFYFALMGLARETYLLIPVTLYVWQYCRRSMTFSRAALSVAIVLLPFLSWVTYLTLIMPQTISTFSFAQANPIPSTGVGRFSLPLLAMWQETLYGIHHMLTTVTNIKRTLSVSVVTTLIFIFSLCKVWSSKSLWAWLTFVQALFCVSTRGDIWNYHASSSRLIIPLMLFAVMWCAEEAVLITSNK